jgi:ketosteroid isomerase-like protein
MFNFLKTAALLLTLATTLNLHAQQISPADQAGLEECYNGFMSAFDHMDATAMGALFTENAENIDPMGTIVRGRANLVANYAGLFQWLKTLPKADRYERKNLNWQSRYLAPDLVLSTYTEESIAYYGDKAQSEKNSFSVLLRKTNGKWLAELITMVPVKPMPAPGN